MATHAPGDPHGPTGEFDVLIVGGGPSGLLVASLLYPALRVGLIEKGTIGRTSKYWITSSHRLAAYDLEDCVHRTYPSALFGTFLGSQLKICGDFALVTEKELLNRLAQRAKQRGVHLFEHCSIVAIRWESHGLVVTTQKGQVHAKLLVDASGGGSPVASTFRLHRLDGFYTIYGQHLASVRLRSRELVGGVVPKLGYPPIIFEAMATSDETVLCSAFVASVAAQRPDSLKAALTSFVTENETFSPTSETELIDERFGVIPIGRPRGQPLPGVVGFGEAGMMQSPLLGGAFNEALVYARGLADSISSAIINDYPNGQPKLYRPFQKRTNDWLQRIVARRIVDGDVVEFQRLVELLSCIRNDIAYRFLASDLTLGEIVRVTFDALMRRPLRSKSNGVS